MYAITMFKIELHEKSSQFKLPILKQYHNSSKHKRPFGLKYLLLMFHPTQGSTLKTFHNYSLEAILHISWCSIKLWNKAPRQFGKSHHGMINTIHTLATAKECLHYSIVVLNNCIMHILKVLLRLHLSLCSWWSTLWFSLILLYLQWNILCTCWVSFIEKSN